MAAFQYRAVNLEGQEISGVLEADTQRQARSQLRSQGLLAVELGTLAGPQGNAGGARRKEPRLTGSDLVLLTRQWATLLDAGQPVDMTPWLKSNVARFAVSSDGSPVDATK